MLVMKPEENYTSTQKRDSFYRTLSPDQDRESRMTHHQRMWFMIKRFVTERLRTDDESDIDERNHIREVVDEKNRAGTLTTPVLKRSSSGNHPTEEKKMKAFENASFMWVHMKDLGCEYDEDIV